MSSAALTNRRVGWVPQREDVSIHGGAPEMAGDTFRVIALALGISSVALLDELKRLWSYEIVFVLGNGSCLFQSEFF